METQSLAPSLSPPMLCYLTATLTVNLGLFKQEPSTASIAHLVCSCFGALSGEKSTFIWDP